MKKIIIGARGSKLSLAYVSRVKSLILESSKNIDIHVFHFESMILMVPAQAALNRIWIHKFS